MEGLIQLSYLPTQSQLANVFTEILPAQQHWTLLDKLNMPSLACCLNTPSLRGVLEITFLAENKETIAHSVPKLVLLSCQVGYELVSI